MEVLENILEFSHRNYYIQELRLSELQFVGGTSMGRLMEVLNETSFNGLLCLKLNDLKLFDITNKEEHTFELLKSFISKNK